ncbi:hypothetical protein BDFB_004617 [Asbolus verrucosus]|uniref:Uncharacterized protein n=1 Tax=Asbolus verrucosus TaxID=1661398 RepID=A0A482WBR9_ASBVE|nr:hypothetical protein BDFB_004617 [Asbolus verrucosus]
MWKNIYGSRRRI